MKSTLQWHRLGRVEYVDGLELQRQFQESRKSNDVPDTLLLLEHPPVLTLGRGAHHSNIIASPEQLTAVGVETFETDRGGDVTYHGPGQIVGYPILHLEADRQDVRKYVRALEELMIRTVADFGIVATRIDGWPGVWVPNSRLGGPRKIAALGVHLSRWYTKHGFALNVETDLSHFDLIVPCGIKQAGVTSMRSELNQDISREQVESRIAYHVGDVFDCHVVEATPPERAVVVVVVCVRDQRMLLLHRQNDQGGYWQPVTGMVENHERFESAAVRELTEETGLSVPLRQLGYQQTFVMGEQRPPKLVHCVAYGGQSSAEANVVLNHREHQAFEWLPWEQAAARVPYLGLKKAMALAASARFGM